MKRYSLFTLAREALRRHRGWSGAWRFPNLKPRYRVAIVGGGGHGLATAWYLAKLHGIRDVVVLEKGWIGGGNTGRNTTIVRSNYQLDDNARFYEHSLRLWEGLSRDLNYNVMFSQRGVLNLAHADSQMDAFARRGNRMRLNGIDAELLDRRAVAKYVPLLDTSDNARFPVLGGPAPGAGRGRAPRRGGVGLRARGGRPRGRHRAGLRGRRHPHRRGLRHRGGDHPGGDRGRAGGARGRRQLGPGRGARGAHPPHRVARPPGVRDRAGEAAPSTTW